MFPFIYNNPKGARRNFAQRRANANPLGAQWAKRCLDLTIKAIVAQRPQPTEEEPQNLSLDKGNS